MKKLSFKKIEEILLETPIVEFNPFKDKTYSRNNGYSQSEILDSLVDKLRKVFRNYCNKQYGKDKKYISVSTYGSGIALKYKKCEIEIKVSKTLFHYNKGVYGDTHYNLKSVKVMNKYYDYLDDFIEFVDSLIYDEKEKERVYTEKFIDTVKKNNVTMNDFMEMYYKYKKLPYDAREKIEKEMGKEK